MDFENNPVLEPKIRNFLSTDNVLKTDTVIDMNDLLTNDTSILDNPEIVINNSSNKNSNEEVKSPKKNSKEKIKKEKKETNEEIIQNKRPKEPLTQTTNSKHSRDDYPNHPSINTERMYRTRPMHIHLTDAYNKQNNIPETPNIILNRSLNPMIDELYEKTVNLARSAGRRAEVYKFIYVIIKILTTISGIIIGVLQVADVSAQQGARYTSMALGFFVSLMQSLLALFPVDRRGILLKKDANKLKKISRHILVLKSLNMPTMEKLKKVEDFYAEVDDIDLDIYTFIGTQSQGYSIRPTI